MMMYACCRSIRSRLDLRRLCHSCNSFSSSSSSSRGSRGEQGGGAESVVCSFSSSEAPQERCTTIILLRNTGDTRYRSIVSNQLPPVCSAGLSRAGEWWRVSNGREKVLSWDSRRALTLPCFSSSLCFLGVTSVSFSKSSFFLHSFTVSSSAGWLGWLLPSAPGALP